MGIRFWLVTAVGLALIGCGSASTTQPREHAPLPPLKRTAGDDPHTTAQGGTVVDPEGKRVDLAESYASANAILVFYRGAW